MAVVSMSKAVLSASRMPVHAVPRTALMDLSRSERLRSHSAVADRPQWSSVLSTAAVPPLVNSSSARKSFAQRGSSLRGTLGGPNLGSPGATGAKGIVAPGQPAATLTMAGTGALALIPANTKGEPFSSSWVKSPRRVSLNAAVGSKRSAAFRARVLSSPRSRPSKTRLT